MTQLEHIGWYLIVIANVHTAAGNSFGTWSFLTLSAITMVVAYISEKRSTK